MISVSLGRRHWACSCLHYFQLFDKLIRIKFSFCDICLFRMFLVTFGQVDKTQTQDFQCLNIFPPSSVVQLLNEPMQTVASVSC